jgi:hypothetical protein
VQAKLGKAMPVGKSEKEILDHFVVWFVQQIFEDRESTLGTSQNREGTLKNRYYLK